MQKHGIIKNGELIISNTSGESYLPIKFGDYPEFDESSQCVLYGDFIEKDGYILVEYKVDDIVNPEEENNFEEGVSNENPFEDYPMETPQKKQSLLEQVSLLKKENSELQKEDMNNKEAIMDLYDLLLGGF